LHHSWSINQHPDDRPSLEIFDIMPRHDPAFHQPYLSPESEPLTESRSPAFRQTQGFYHS